MHLHRLFRHLRNGSLLLAATVSATAQAALVPPTLIPQDFFISAGVSTFSEGGINEPADTRFHLNLTRDSGRTFASAHADLRPERFLVTAEAQADGTSQRGTNGQAAAASLQVYGAFQVDTPGIYDVRWSQGSETQGGVVIANNARVAFYADDNALLNSLGPGEGSVQFTAQPGTWYFFMLSQSARAAGGVNASLSHVYATLTVSPVPEPAALLLMGFGTCLTLAAAARRKRAG